MPRTPTDFDRMFLEDVEAEPIPYILFGREGVIPASIPYGLILMYQKLAKEDADTDVDGITLHEMLEKIFGTDTVSFWVSQPAFDTQKMTTILRWAMEQYGLAGKEKEEKKTPKGKAKIVQLRQET